MRNQNRVIFFLIFLSNIFISCKDEQKNLENLKTIINFRTEVFDFGTIAANEDATAVFKFSNKGGNPLIVTDVQTTCGCTVPEYPKEPLKPDEMAEIKVIYDAKYPGRFSKTISVYYNGKDSPKILTVKGEVPYPKDMNIVNP